tara:strand:+ start:13056 stop:14693 length:1638 start_codon:yes stop_codon:yes gene_type:complete
VLIKKFNFKIDGDLEYKINNMLFEYSDNGPILDCTNIKWAEILRVNHKKIYNEYLNFIENYQNANLHSKQVGTVASKIDKNKKWKTIILYEFGKKTNFSKYFPYTMKLLKKVPTVSAMFSIMEPGAVLTPHHGVYSGVLRYHLGLKTPRENHKCYINILNYETNEIIKRNWRDGEDIYFDDMYTHWVENKTNERRIILFLDIKKKFSNIFINTVNNILLLFTKYNYNKNFVLNKDIIKINNLLNEQDNIKNINLFYMKKINNDGNKINNYDFFYKKNEVNSESLNIKENKYIKLNNFNIKNKIFPYFIENTQPTEEELKKFELFQRKNYITSESNNVDFWIKYYTFMHRDDIYSMSSESDIEFVEKIITMIENNKIDGDVIEIGSWRGGMCMYIRHLLKNSKKKIWLFDTFNNFPESKNESNNEIIYNFYKDTYFSIEQIKNNFKKFNLYENIEIINGNIKNTIYNDNIKKISLLRLDCDLYEPILLSLQELYPKIEKGGIVLIDDYNNYLVNCYKAVNDYRKNNNITSPVIREPDGDSIYWIKN